MTGQIRQGAVVVVIARSGQNGEVRNMHGVCLEYGRGLVTGAGGLAGWLAGWVLQCGVQQPLPPPRSLGRPQGFYTHPPQPLQAQAAARMPSFPSTRLGWPLGAQITPHGRAARAQGRRRSAQSESPRLRARV